MDTSPEYIKMCEKAELDLVCPLEIKTIGYLFTGIVWQDGNCFYSRFHFDMPSSNKLIWLPRQDQLQEMVGDYEYQIITVANCVGEYYGFDKLFDSWEKFWLNQVMKIKFHKTWNGEDWI